MTSFNESRPQSRREARESERLLREREQASHAPVEPVEPATELPAAELPDETSTQPEVFEIPGAESDATDFSDTKYPPTPSIGRRARQDAPQAAPEAPPIIPASAEPAFRERDFSPEGFTSRASGRRAAAADPTEFAVSEPVVSDPVVVPVASEPAVASAEPQVLSRRELRLRQAEADAQAQALAEAATPAEEAQPASLTSMDSPPLAPPMMPPPSTMTTPPPLIAPQQANSTPPPLDVPHEPAHPTALSNAMAEFEALTRTNNPVPPTAYQPDPPVADESMAQDFATPTFIEPTIAVSNESVQPPQDAASGPRTGGYVPPTGHWSRQLDLDDETQPWENTITREVGGGNVATTTSALVLPEIPLSPHFSSALDSTGEVLLTGSIDLPRSLSTIGGDSRSYDGPQVDYMFESQDAEYTGTDSAPVRAIRAVSTQTSARGVIHSTKPHGNRMLVVGFIATAVLAVAVAGVFVAALVFKVF